MNSAESTKFIEDVFLPAIHAKFKERWPDAFDICHKTGEEYKNANPSIYSHYMGIIRGVHRRTETPKYTRTIEKVVRVEGDKTITSIDAKQYDDWSHVQRMYDDFMAADNGIEWLIEFIPIISQ